jgi:hypothetical protein
MNELIIQNFIVKCALFYHQGELYILEAYEDTLIKLICIKGKINMMNPLLFNYILANNLVVDTRTTLRKIIESKHNLPEVDFFLNTVDYSEIMERYISHFKKTYPKYDLIQFL